MAQSIAEPSLPEAFAWERLIVSVFRRCGCGGVAEDNIELCADCLREAEMDAAEAERECLADLYREW